MKGHEQIVESVIRKYSILFMNMKLFLAVDVDVDMVGRVCWRVV
jgi:hypothetical protein